MATRTQLANRIQRQPGTHTSPSMAVPAGTTELTVELDITLQNRSDPNTTVRGAIEYSDDANGLTWYPWVSGVWRGGAIDPDTGNPYVMTLGSSVPANAKWVRGILDTPTRLSLGLVVITEP